MKNKIFLFIGMISIIAVTLISAAFGSVVNASSTDLEDKEYEESLKRNWDIAVLATDVERVIDDYYKIVDRFSDIYPSYFGGMYINDDATALVVQIVKNNIPKENSNDYKIYNKLINFDEKIKIEYVDYSFNELNQANNNVSDFISSKSSNISSKIMSIESSKEMKDNIVGTYIDVVNNSIVVEVLEENDIQNQEFITSILNEFKTSENKIKDTAHQLIDFKKGKIASTYRTINAGGGLTYGCSMGFRTKNNGRVGYVTAGHCVENKKMIADGIVEEYHFGNNQKFDYAFISTIADINLTNKLEYGGKNVTKLAVVNYCPILTSNLKIAKSGDKTKYTTGKIIGFNETSKFEDNKGNVYTIKGLVKSDLKADNGDSGGTVMIPKTDSQGGAVAIGVINGGSKKGIVFPTYTTYFTDINDMATSLQARY